MTQLSIRSARDRAATIDTSLYRIDWSKVKADKRAGHIYAWRSDGRFIGQFRNHDRAYAAGAEVSKIDNYWFSWQ